MSGLPEVGARFGRYQINRLIGRGGVGVVVYEASDTMLRRTVALKVSPPGLSLGDDQQPRFSREADLLSRLRSRNVVTVLDHGMIDGAAYLSTEFFPDGDLASWLRARGAMAREQTLGLVSQVCGALVDAHAVGVVHGRLEPSVVLLRNRLSGLVPYLSDFGTAGGSELADQRGVGWLLHACATGDPAGASSHTPGPTGDAAIDHIVHRALSADPAQRYASMSELRAALDRIASGEAVDAAEIPPDAADATPTLEPEAAPEPAPQPEPEPLEEPVRAQAEPAAVAPRPPLEAFERSPATASIPEPPEAPEPVAAVAATRRSRPPAAPSGSRRRWWPVAAGAAVVLLVGGVAAFALNGGDDPADPMAAASPSATTQPETPTPSVSPSAAVTPTPTVPSTSPSLTPPPAPVPTIGRLTRSSAACQGTAGDYQKWQYALTGFKPGRTFTPHLAIRSDRGNGETSGKPVTVSAKGRARGDFCVPSGTHGTVTITVAGTTARRQIG